MGESTRRSSGLSVYDVAAVGSFLLAVVCVMAGLEVLAGVLALGGVGFSILGIGTRLDNLVDLGRTRGALEEEAGARFSDARTQMERIAQALETSGRTPLAPPLTDPAAVIREAIREGRWDEVLERVELLRAEGGLSSELEEEVARHRESARTDLTARLDASRQANDAESVLSYRARLVPLLAEEERRWLDSGLVGWFMALLMRRMRAGTVRADVAQLAEAIAEAFPATAEGASVRASLPTLRRSAGLCARCAQPYLGEEDACPRCLGQAVSEGPVEAGPEPDDDFPPVERSGLDDPFEPSE